MLLSKELFYIVDSEFFSHHIQTSRIYAPLSNHVYTNVSFAVSMASDQFNYVYAVLSLFFALVHMQICIVWINCIEYISMTREGGAQLDCD